LAIGVGFAMSQIETIYPQPFDVPMDVIITEADIRRR
jgi:5-formyltetrahydrofolate cyclo-ligase